MQLQVIYILYVCNGSTYLTIWVPVLKMDEHCIVCLNVVITQNVDPPARLGRYAYLLDYLTNNLAVGNS
jgi:hypothetical protein